jgi:hypothetical protein
MPSRVWGDQRMLRSPSAARSALYAFAATLAVSLGGCGGFDGVQLNGKIFDAMGMSGDSAAKEPKMAQRTGLVVPPSTTGALPVPGSGQDPQAADVAALQDPDKLAHISQEEKQRQQDAYCKVNYEQAKARGDDNADLAEGPLGPCKGSVITALKKWQGGGGDDEEQ